MIVFPIPTHNKFVANFSQSYQFRGERRWKFWMNGAGTNFTKLTEKYSEERKTLKMNE